MAQPTLIWIRKLYTFFTGGSTHVLQINCQGQLVTIESNSIFRVVGNSKEGKLLKGTGIKK